MSIAQNFPNLKPSLLLDFSNTEALDSRVTFARASTARAYDGKTVAKAEENLLIRSQEFDNASWLKTNVTVTANTEVAPDGTTTADTIADNSTSGTHRATQLVSINANTTYAVSCFVKAGTGSFAYLSVTDSGANQRYFAADFDLSTGAVRISGAGTSGTLSLASITEFPSGSGWYRCVIVGQIAVVSSTTRIVLGVSSGSDSFTIDGFVDYAGTGSTIIAWGAQLEQRSSVTAYTPTTTQPITNYIPVLQTAAAGVARFDHNPITGESLGLLIEEQRTNLLLRSEEFDNAAWKKGNASDLSVSPNQAVAPDGTLTADRVYENTTITNKYLFNSPGITISASLAYTGSVYAKAGERSRLILGLWNGSNYQLVQFDLANGTILQEAVAGIGAITAVGNGWYRCSVTRTPGVTTTFFGIGPYINANIGTLTGNFPSFTGDGFSGIYIWGAQLEAGAFPTSYIPTTTAQVTRSADAASMTGTNFSSWYRADRGTVYSEANRFSNAATFPAVFQIDDGTDSNRINTEIRNTTGTVFGSAVLNGSNVAGLGSAAVGSSYAKLAFTFKVNDFAFSHNGTTALTDTSGGVPVVNAALLGARRAVGVSQFLNGTIKKLAFYPERLSDAQLQALTQN
jgi:hypothetical protein